MPVTFPVSVPVPLNVNTPLVETGLYYVARSEVRTLEFQLLNHGIEDYVYTYVFRTVFVSGTFDLFDVF